LVKARSRQAFPLLLEDVGAALGAACRCLACEARFAALAQRCTQLALPLQLASQLF